MRPDVWSGTAVRTIIFPALSAVHVRDTSGEILASPSLCAGCSDALIMSESRLARVQARSPRGASLHVMATVTVAVSHHHVR